MRVVVYFQSGKVSEFNTETFCAAEPFSSEGGPNVATEFSLRLDRIADDGLVLQVFWYSAAIDGDTAYTPEPEVGGREVAHAMREPGRNVRLLSRAEIEEIAKVEVDGQMVLWRQGEDLVNATRFRNAELLCYSDAVQVSLNARLVGVWEYLQRAYPASSDEELADRIGYPLRAVRRAQAEERAQGAEGELGAEGGDEGAADDGIGALEAFLGAWEGEER